MTIKQLFFSPTESKIFFAGSNPMKINTMSILTLLLLAVYGPAGAEVRFINYDLPQPERTNRVVDLVVTPGNFKSAAVRNSGEGEKSGGVAYLHNGVWEYATDGNATAFAPLAVDLKYNDKFTEAAWWAAGDNRILKVWVADSTYRTAEGSVKTVSVFRSQTFDAAYFGFPGEVTFRDIAVDRDNSSIWFAGNKGILRLGDNEWNILDGPATCIAIDRRGVKYFGSETSGVVKCAGLACTNLVPAASLSGGVTAIAVDSLDRLWFATYRPGQAAGSPGTSEIVRYEKGKLTRLVFPDPLDRAFEVADMAADEAGNIWLATLGGGAKKYDGATWSGYTARDGLADDTVNTVAVESVKKIWFGTDNGVSLLFNEEKYDLLALPDEKIFTGSPLVDSTGNVFLGRADGNFYAYAISSSYYDLQVAWTFKTGAAILSSPAVGRSGVFYFGSDDHYIYALYPDGTLKWRYETGDGVVSSPAVGADGTVYAGSKDGCLYALNPNGTLKWRYATGGPVWSSPGLATDGTIYFGSHDKSFYAVSPAGELKWSYPTGGAIFSSPAVGYQGTIYFGSNDYSIYALNPDGSLRWSYSTGGEVISSPAVDFDETVYVGSSDYYLYAITPKGTLAWRYGINAPVWSSPVINTAGQIECRSSNIAEVDLDFGPVPLEDYPVDHFTVEKNGKIFSSGETNHGNSSSPAVSVKGQVRFVNDANAGMEAGSNLVAGYDGKTDWPKFRHDYRNTGNVATSLEITVKDLMEPPPREVACDVNGDGRINVVDAVKLIIKGRDNPNDLALDFDRDGKYTILDVIYLLLAMQIGTCQPAGAALASGAALAADGPIPGLSAEDIAYVEQVLPQLDLTSDQEAEFRLSLYGEAGIPGLPKAFSLSQNAPNPFNPATTISYTVPAGSTDPVNLSVYDLLGRRVRTLVSETRGPGSYSVFWDGTDEAGRKLASGVYFCRLKAGEFRSTRKMVLLK